MCSIFYHFVLFKFIYMLSIPTKCEIWGYVWCCWVHAVRAVVSGYVEM